MTDWKLLRYRHNFREYVYVHMYVCISVHVCVCICVCALCALLCTWCVCVHLFACMYTSCIPVFMGCWKQRSYQSLKRNSNQFSSKCHHFWAPRHLLAGSLTVAPLKNPYWQQRALCQGWQSCVCLPLLKIKMTLHARKSNSTLVLQIWTN